MFDTIWVRPAGYGGQFLVFKSKKLLKNAYSAFFNIDDPEQFLSQVEESELEPEFYDEMEQDNHDTAVIEKDGDKEEIDFKLVKMSGKDFEGIGEFEGW